MTRRLRAGDRIQLVDGQIYIVEKADDCSALVRPETTKPITIDGRRTFSARGRAIHISPYSEVELIGRATEEQLMATRKKTSKTTGSKATTKPKRAKSGLPKGEITFAIRITKSEREAIRKATEAAGTSATVWAREVLAAAAK